jgi:hypothetical protein
VGGLLEKDDMIDTLALIGFIYDYVDDLKDSIRVVPTTRSSATRAYALAHCDEILIQLKYIELALENR